MSLACADALMGIFGLRRVEEMSKPLVCGEYVDGLEEGIVKLKAELAAAKAEAEVIKKAFTIAATDRLDLTKANERLRALC